MSLPATLLGMVAAGAVMAGLVMIDRAVRTDAAIAQTQRTLRQLNHALMHYTQQHETFPAGSSYQAIAALRRHPDTAALLDVLPMQQHSNDRWHITDGFGRPLHYRPANQTRHRRAEFVSAGVDGRFGDALAHAPVLRRESTDNIHGSDLTDRPMHRQADRQFDRQLDREEGSDR